MSLYYTAPNDKCFDELKEKAIELWTEISDYPNYLKEKVGRLDRMSNIQDNFMYIIAMFDINNMRKLSLKLSKETRKEIRERLIDGGGSNEYDMF